MRKDRFEREGAAYQVTLYRREELADKAVSLIYQSDDESIVAGVYAATTFRRTDALPRLRQIGELSNPDYRGQIPLAIEELESIERTRAKPKRGPERGE